MGGSEVEKYCFRIEVGQKDEAVRGGILRSKGFDMWMCHVAGQEWVSYQSDSG